MSSVVTDDTVIAFGGIDWSDGMSDALATNRAWQWSP